MAYKLMAVDIDGTLLDSKGNLTEETEKAIRLGVEKGLIFTISTGRPVQGVQAFIDKLDLDLPVITYNGAMVIMGKSKEVLYQCTMDPKDAREVIDLGEKYGTSIMVWADNKLFANRLNERAYEYSKISGVMPVLMEDVEETISQGVLKILWYDEVETIKKYQKDIGKYISRNINYHTSQPYFLEFVDKNASKAKAMEKIGEYFGIDRSEMIAVGDGFNDLSMIEYAGLGVAMGNASNEIKERADYVTLTNDENGLAHVIYKFVLDTV
ncbi:MAG: HAD family phosphatase [Firmicutes bacterium]|nr:HAD family phosphatase [Bacillota bacterium]